MKALKYTTPGFALAAAAALLAATPLRPGAAQSPPPAPKLNQVSQLLSIQNRSGQPITEAQATLQGSGEAKSFTANGAIPPNLGQKVFVPPGSCMSGVSVTFKDGRTLRLDKVDDCRKSLIVVTNDHIELTSGASTNPPNRELHYNQVLPH